MDIWKNVFGESCSVKSKRQPASVNDRLGDSKALPGPKFRLYLAFGLAWKQKSTAWTMALQLHRRKWLSGGNDFRITGRACVSLDDPWSREFDSLALSCSSLRKSRFNKWIWNHKTGEWDIKVWNKADYIERRKKKVSIAGFKPRKSDLWLNSNRKRASRGIILWTEKVFFLACIQAKWCHSLRFEKDPVESHRKHQMDDSGRSKLGVCD